MRHLGLALYGEGPTDHRFLAGVLPRLVVSLLGASGAEIDVMMVEARGAVRDDLPSVRAERIAHRAVELHGGFHLLFVHADAGTDPSGARELRAEPGISLALSRTSSAQRAGVPVVPVRETESWAIADLEAIAAASGGGGRLREVEQARGSAPVESVADAKALLDQLVAAASPRRRSRRQLRGRDLLEALGVDARLSSLRTCPSFVELEAETAAALEGIGALPGGTR